jgi:hypothetical protein
MSHIISDNDGRIREDFYHPVTPLGFSGIYARFSKRHVPIVEVTKIDMNPMTKRSSEIHIDTEHPIQGKGRAVIEYPYRDMERGVAN